MFNSLDKVTKKRNQMKPVTVEDFMLFVEYIRKENKFKDYYKGIFNLTSLDVFT